MQRWKTKNKKKFEFFHFFAECHDHDTRQSWESGTLSFPALPSVMGKALGKENKKKLLCRVPTYSTRQRKSKKKENKLCRVPDAGTRQSILKKIKNTFLCRVPMRGTRQRGRHRGLAITTAFLCRVPSWHSGNPLPSARHAALGKEAFAVKGYADSSLPSATLGKDFAECSTRQRLCRVQSLLCRV